MTLVFACEVVLAGLLVAIATWTIVARTAFAAIVVFMVYGLLLAIVWVALSAVDVALTEAAIGGGVTSIVLLGAASRLRGSKAAIPSVSFPFKITAGVLCAVVSAGLATVVFFLPDVAPTLAPVAKENLAESGLGNPVAAVLFVFRALDTLLEKVVLLLALVGVWS
ncbi:MAG: hydrogenase subunit MbhD domain-containing protein, partial [Pseudolabrys sp.]